MENRIEELESRVKELEEKVSKFNSDNYASQDMASYCKNDIIPIMDNLRDTVDSMETICNRKSWPYPTYGDLLFGVK